MDIRLHKASSYNEIICIGSNSYSYLQFEDKDRSEDVSSFFSTALVNQFISKGDTNGYDIGNETNDDAYLIVKFNPIQIEVQK